MQIICISRGTFAGGMDLARNMAKKLGYACLSREELVDQATESGIRVGKLEMNMVRRRPLSEQMAVEKERFTAFVTAALCENALKSSLVYHGRTGHLVLPGVNHVLRVRAIMDPEQRIESTMHRLTLNREKAKAYNDEVDEDRRRWVRTFYNIDWQDPANYDLVVNLSHLNTSNAAAALVGMAQLPEFQVTPANQRALRDLLLASRCRLALGNDPRTQDMTVQVRADSGVVTINYLPRYEKKVQAITDVLQGIEGVHEILCTMATTNLLWIQESFTPQSAALEQILQIAGKWNAAIDMIKLSETAAESAQEPGAEDSPELMSQASENGGILDDRETAEDYQDDNIKQVKDRLISAGRAGGYRAIAGGAQAVLSSLDRTAPYNLVVVGDVFLSKGESVRKRLSREMVGNLADNLHVPVIGTDDLKAQYLFGPGQWIKLIVFGTVAALLVLLVFSYQTEILRFFSQGTCMWNECTQVTMKHRILSAVILFVSVPIFAYVYGNFTRYLLRLVRFD